MQKLPIYYSPEHQLHQPRYEYDRGIQIPYQEVPQRIEVTLEAFSSLPACGIITPEVNLPMVAIERIHTPDLIQHLMERSHFAAQQEQQMQQEDLYLYPWIWPHNPNMRNGLLNSPDSAGCYAFDSYAPIGKNTWQAVYASANLAYQAALAVARGESKVAYALCRPPGHHAGKDTIGGYCYMNNAALAADQLHQALGRGVVLDIDYHHGNGTQEIFWQEPEVLFISIHADPTDEYPFFSGFADERGGDAAVGCNLNIPLPKGCDDQTYLHALAQAFTSIQNFQPNWLVLSAGFDTSYADPSTFFELSDKVFDKIGNRIGSLNLPVVIVHEGGYAVQKNGSLAVILLAGISKY
jgi:acetoin utilization deacetylase AcuC-like enzyme